MSPDGAGISTSAFYKKDGAGTFVYGGQKGGHTYFIDAAITASEVNALGGEGRNVGNKFHQRSEGGESLSGVDFGNEAVAEHEAAELVRPFVPEYPEADAAKMPAL